MNNAFDRLPTHELAVLRAQAQHTLLVAHRRFFHERDALPPIFAEPEAWAIFRATNRILNGRVWS